MSILARGAYEILSYGPQRITHMASKTATQLPTLSLTRDQMQTLANGKPVTIHVQDIPLGSISRVKLTTTTRSGRNGSMETIRLSQHALAGFLYEGTYSTTVNGTHVRLDGTPLREHDEQPPVIVDAEWVGPSDGIRRSFKPLQ